MLYSNATNIFKNNLTHDNEGPHIQNDMFVTNAMEKSMHIDREMISHALRIPNLGRHMYNLRDGLGENNSN